jgi:hypothetical protein
VAAGDEPGDSGASCHRVDVNVAVLLVQAGDAALEFMMHPLTEFVRPGAYRKYR